jgi:hypothetical protein
LIFVDFSVLSTRKVKLKPRRHMTWNIYSTAGRPNSLSQLRSQTLSFTSQLQHNSTGGGLSLSSLVPCDEIVNGPMLWPTASRRDGFASLLLGTDLNIIPLIVV